jgi:N-acetylmuramoyl-L-alanine amidase
MYSANDVDILARTIWAEARGESQQGKRAVAWTVLNRVAAKSWYGKTVASVCLKPWQFSCWNENDPNLPKLQAVDLNRNSYRNAMCAALSVMQGHSPDPTEGSRHYHASNVRPLWAKGHTPVVRLGRHAFYNDII